MNKMMKKINILVAFIAVGVAGSIAVYQSAQRSKVRDLAQAEGDTSTADVTFSIKDNKKVFKPGDTVTIVIEASNNLTGDTWTSITNGFKCDDFTTYVLLPMKGTKVDEDVLWDVSYSDGNNYAFTDVMETVIAPGQGYQTGIAFDQNCPSEVKVYTYVTFVIAEDTPLGTEIEFTSSAGLNRYDFKSGAMYNKLKINRNFVDQDGNKVTGTAGKLVITVDETSNKVQYKPGANGTGTIADQTKEEGIDLTLSTEKFTRTGYQQTGWSLTDGGPQAYALGATYNKDESIVLYPVWTKECTVTVEVTPAAYGTASKTTLTVLDGTAASYSGSTITVGSEKVTITPKAADAQYSYSIKSISCPTKITDDTTITVTMQQTAKQYTMSFNSNGGSSVAAKTQGYGTTVTAPTAPTRAGYTFGGWYTDNNTFTKPYTFSTMPAQNTTLYAKWTANTYTVTFDANTGTCDTTSKSVTFGQAYGTLPEATKAGSNFVGWFTSATGGTQVTSTTNVSATGNHTLFAHYSANSYTITFNSNGGSAVSKITAAYGATITKPTNPSRAGHTFDGWYTDNNTFANEFSFSTMPASNVTLYAKWTANTYNVTFNPNGGAIDESDRTVTYGELYGTLPVPNRYGYSFTGWYTSATGGTSVTSTTRVTATSNHSIYAHWTADSHTITFNSNGGSAVSSITAAYGSAVTKPANPTKTGYTFAGWYTDNNTFANAYTFSTMGSEDVTLYAKWSTNAYTVTVKIVGYGTVTKDTFAADYGTDISISSDLKTITVGSETATFSLPNNPDEYVYSVKAECPTNKVNGDVTITYTVTRTAQPYGISYKSNGGTSIPAETHGFGTAITAPVSPTKTGYTFGGWYEDSALTKAFAFTTMPAKDLVLYAKWNPIQYTITFNSNGGSAVASMTEDFGASLTAPTAPTKEGNSFGGWYTDSALTSRYTFTTMPAQNTTLYAKWIADEHTITFNSNGGSAVAAITQDFGTTVTKPANPTKVGYVFAGWYTDNNSFANQYTFTTMPSDDITLYAKWSADSLVITSIEGEGTTLTVVEAADFNTQVTVTAVLKEDYKDLKVEVYKTGDKSTKVTVTDGKFMMPSYAVTVETSALPVVKIVDDKIAEGDGLPTISVGGELFTYPFHSPDFDVEIYQVSGDGTRTPVTDLENLEDGNYIIAVVGKTERIPGTEDFEFSVEKTELTVANVQAGYVGEYAFNNKVPEFEDLVLEANGKTLTIDVDYILTAYDKKVGEGYKVTVSGIGHYSGEFDLDYKIVKNNALEETRVTAAQKDGETLVYSGEARIPTIVISVDGEEFDEPFTVKYYTDDTRTVEVPNPTDAGSYVAVITTSGENFQPIELTVNFDIHKAVYDMTGIEFPDVKVAADGNAKAASITGELPEGVTVTYKYYSDEAHTKEVKPEEVVEEGVYYAVAIFEGSDNYEPIDEMYAVVTIEAAAVIEIVDGSKMIFIMLHQYEESYEFDGETIVDQLAYRKGYPELGMIHGVDDKDFDKVILGNVSPDTSLAEFLKNFKTDMTLLKITNKDGEVIFENGHVTAAQLELWVDDGVTEETFMNDPYYFAVSTGTKVEYINNDKLLDTVIVSVLGDTDCDGTLTASDYGIVKMNIIDSSLDTLPLEVILACYVENDGATPANVGTNYYGTIKMLIVDSASTEPYFNTTEFVQKKDDSNQDAQNPNPNGRKAISEAHVGVYSVNFEDLKKGTKALVKAK